jgi:hypothetical protein
LYAGSETPNAAGGSTGNLPGVGLASFFAPSIAFALSGKEVTVPEFGLVLRDFHQLAIP